MSTSPNNPCVNLVERLRQAGMPNSDAWDAADEIEQLRAWKAEALTVLAGWNATWDAAGRPGRLGQSQSEAVADEIEKWRCIAHERWRTIQRLRDAAEAALNG